MNGLACQRRKRGLAGSVLNIGVIYGLGLLHRERENIYHSLERDGYPPISERDIRHMMLEAIVAGRPVAGQIPDITTGLSRYRVNEPKSLHWHRDPRFSHYTVWNDEDSEKNTKSKKESLSDRLVGLTLASEINTVLLEFFAAFLEGMLQLPEGTVNGDSNIAGLGVDSLFAVEIRSWIWKSIKRDVPVLKILGSASIQKCRSPCLLSTWFSASPTSSISLVLPLFPLTPIGGLCVWDIGYGIWYIGY
jgi:hypothetical protein